MLLTSGEQLLEAKVVLIGDSMAGKSSIVNRLTRNTFSTNTSSTIGSAFSTHTVPVNGKQMKMSIWDTSGSERYRSMAPMYYRNSNAAILVYDLTSASSFSDATVWLKELREKGPSNIIIALAGNKSDLEKQRAVTTESAQSFAKKNGIEVFKETSALTNSNIQEIFAEVANLIVNHGTTAEGGAQTVDIQVEPAKKKEHICCK